MNLLLLLGLIFYILYTGTFALKFNKSNIYYNKRQIYLHNILIWLIPFIWIILLKTIDKPTLGRGYNTVNSETINKEGDTSWLWAMPIVSFFHGSRNSSENNDYNSNDSLGGSDGEIDSTDSGSGDGGGGD